jgi:hypothetical protein
MSLRGKYSFFGCNSKLSKMATETGSLGKLNTESTELLIRAVLEFSFNNYTVDMKKKIEELSFLHHELRKVQQKSRFSVASATKRVTDIRVKEQIISKKNERLDKLNKENGSLRKQISLLKKENSKALQDKEKISNTD